jgi:hypothetical protein
LKNHSELIRVAAIICAVLFGISLVISLFAFNIESQFFNPQVYKQVIDQVNVCERIPAVITQQITSSENSQNRSGLMGLLIGSLKPEKLQGLIEMVLPCQVVEKVAFSGIDQMFSVINGATDQTGLSLNPIKQSIGENSAAALDDFLNSQPDCTTEQLLEIGANALFGEGDYSKMVLCNPPDLMRKFFTIPLGLLVDETIKGLPEQFQVTAGLQNVIDTIRFARGVMNWSPLFPLLFLGLTTALVVRSWRSLLRWWGIPLLISGLAALIISLAMGPSVHTFMGYLILPNLPGNLVPSAVQLIADVFATVAQGIVKPTQYQSAIISLIGLMMVLGERLSRQKG